VFVIQFREMFLFTFVLIKKFIINFIHLSDLLLASLPTYRPTHFNGLDPALFNKWLKCLDSEQNKTKWSQSELSQIKPLFPQRAM